MGTAHSVTVTGLSRTVRDLERMGVSVDDLKDAFGRITAEGVQIASGAAPHVSGALAGTVRGSRTKNKSVVRAGGAAARYAGVQNYGWPARGIPAKKYMQEVDAQLGPRAPQMLEDELRTLIRKYNLQ